MSPQEFEQALHDAEVKLARLKALYEQWFQGIEKLEPSVPRKELDRSLDLLKKSIPRNTALRFRMQQLIARYGTYGIYWGRISRQIEEGTYRRDILRAQKKAQTTPRRAEATFELDVDVELDGMDDLVGNGPAIATPTATTRPNDLDAILNTLAPPSDDGPKARSARPLSPFAMGGARPAGGASATFGKPKDKPAAAAATVAIPNLAPPAPASVVAPKAVVAPPKPVIPPIVSKPTAPMPITGTVPRPPMPPAPVAAKPLVPAPPMMPKPATPPAVAKPIAAPPTMNKPTAPAMSVPKPVPAPAPPRPEAPTPSGNLDDGQMRAIYSRYVDARRQNNERTDVRYEALAESVQKMMPKLREKHAGKPIDFEIVLQNGKVGLKPKVGR